MCMCMDSLTKVTFERILEYWVSQKIRQNPGNSKLLVQRLILFLPGCLTRRKINATRIVLFKSTIKLNNFSSDKKYNL